MRNFMKVKSLLEHYAVSIGQLFPRCYVQIDLAKLHN